MRRISVGLLLAVAGLIALSCSNFAMPERVHVKAGINPAIPINPKSDLFKFSEFQDQLNEVFTGQDGKIGFFNYKGGSGDAQQFLLSFPISEQKLDFEDYLSGDDMKLSSSLEKINKTLELTAPDTKDTKISIDMSNTITEILEDIVWPIIPSLPIVKGTGTISTTSLPTPLPPLPPAEGFSSLSFYSGNLEVTFSIPTGQTGSVTLSNLKIDSIASSLSTYTLNSSNRTETVQFPLADKTLTNSFNLSFTYSAPDIPLLDVNNTLDVAIDFSSNVQLKTVKGVTFDDVAEPLENADPIDPDLPPEFVQATINKGSIKLDTGGALKGVFLGLSGITIKQDSNTSAPSYKEPEASEEVSLTEGLSVPGLEADKLQSLTGQKINPQDITMSGMCALSVPDQAKTEITFNQDGKLEIAVSFALESFSVVYIDGQTVMDDFNKSDDSNFELDLGDLGKTVTSIEIAEVGAELVFGESPISGLFLSIDAPMFKVNEVKHPVKKGTERFVNNNGEVTTDNPNGSAPFTYNLTEENSKVPFKFELTGTPIGSGTGSVLKLENIQLGKDVTIIDCTPTVIFDWTEATIDPQAAAGGDSDFTQGTFPGKGADPFTLMGKGNELEKYLKNMEFSDIKGYLFFSGPPLDPKKNPIKLTLTAFPNATLKEGIAPEEPINLISKPFNPPKGKTYTSNIASAKSSTKEPLSFTDTFNRMLGGEELTINYTLDFGDGLTIKKEDVTGTGGVKEFKADLVIILPLKLVPGKDVKEKEIDVTENLGERARNNLLDFTANMGDSTKVDFTTLALNITLTGAPITKGLLIIERPPSDGVAADKLKLEIPLNSSSIKIDLADYLVGANPKFTPNRVALIIKEGGSLTIPQSLSLFELSVNAGVDVMYNF